MNILWLLVGRPTGAEQSIDQSCEPVGLANDDIGVLALFCIGQQPFQQLCCAANAPQRIFDLMRQLANHLPTGTVLY